jgi:hypothetical protein
MVWLLKLGLVWLSLDVLIIATGWYLVKAVKPNFPHWWQRVIADESSLPAEIAPDKAKTVESSPGGELWNTH